MHVGARHVAPLLLIFPILYFPSPPYPLSHKGRGDFESFPVEYFPLSPLWAYSPAKPGRGPGGEGEMLDLPLIFADPVEQSYAIGYGQTARNLINHRHHGWTYYFDARRGDLVTISVTALDGDLDPYVILQDVNGNTLAEDDDGGEGRNARLVYGVRADGLYNIFITRFQGDRATSAGRFELSLEGVRDGLFGPPPEGHEALRYGQGVSSVITAEQRAVLYAFIGWRGDTINLGVSRRDGTFTPRAEVYLPGGARPFLDLSADANGTILVEGVALPLTGYYTLRVAPALHDSPDASGAFQVNLDGAPGAPPERREGVVVAGLAPGMSAQGSLDDAIAERYFAFEGHERQFVRATMTVASGDLAPLLILLDEDGDTVAFDDNPTGAEIAQARLPRTGRYLLVAGRVRGAGGFALDVRALAGDEIALAEGAVSVTLRWDSAANLDLIVRDPAGDALSPEARRIDSGGVLQVDANASCALAMPLPVEHAYWPTPAPAGVYEVVVWNRDSCGAPGATAFELVIAVDSVEVARTQGGLLPDGQYRTTFAR